MKLLISIFMILISCLCSSYGKEYFIGPEDVLLISVFREDDLKKEVRVASNGKISFPLLGQFVVSNLTISQLENKIVSGLKKYIKSPQVSISIKEYSNVAVTGEVKKPGVYPLSGTLSIVEAVSIAWGFTKIAAKNKVLIISRDGMKKRIIQMNKIKNELEKKKDLFLERGDVVYVPESFF